MILVTKDAPGAQIVRLLIVFGYDDIAHGHAEIVFQNVCVHYQQQIFLLEKVVVLRLPMHFFLDNIQIPTPTQSL